MPKRKAYSVLRISFSLFIYLSLVFRPAFQEALHYLYHEISHTLYQHHHHTHKHNHVHQQNTEKIEAIEPEEIAREEKIKHGHRHAPLVDLLIGELDVQFKEGMSPHAHAQFSAVIPLHYARKPIKIRALFSQSLKRCFLQEILKTQHYKKPFTPPPEESFVNRSSF